MRISAKQKLTNGLFSKKIKTASTRDGYGQALVELGEKNSKVVVLCADLSESTRAIWFKEKFPERFVEVGVAEQNLAGVAAGIAMEGYIPFMSSFAVFSPGRNWEQIRVGVCYSKANVKIAGSHAGISVGEDGATHQALEDIALARVLPNMTVIAPCDAQEAQKATIASADAEGPFYIRLARRDSPVFTTKKSPFEVGTANVLSQGSDVTIIGCGPIVYEALCAARNFQSKYKIRAEVINCHTIKPIDARTIVESAQKTGAVVSVEEHQIYGGLGSAVSEVLSAHCPVPMKFVGMPDSFGESGKPDELLEKYGMTKERIVQAGLEVIRKKHRDDK